MGVERGKLIIREERPEDYEKTEEMTLRAFWNLHGPECNEHLLVHNLRNADCYIPALSRVAEIDGTIVGTIMYSHAQIQNQTGVHDVLSFGPLAIDPAAQNMGVGRALLQETLKLAREQGYTAICIFGEPEYYPKFGFKTADNYGITDWNGGNSDAFMGLELQEGALMKLGGRFREYPVYDTYDPEELRTLTRQYSHYPVLHLPTQWGYDNAYEDKAGYHVVDATHAPKVFTELYNAYVQELGTYLPELLTDRAGNGDYLPQERDKYFADPCKKPYLLMRDDRAVGLTVLSGPNQEEKSDGCDYYIEELYVSPEYRGQKIATDLITRYIRQNEGICGFCVLKTNQRMIDYIERLFGREGYVLEQLDNDDSWFYRARK